MRDIFIKINQKNKRNIVFFNIINLLNSNNLLTHTQYLNFYHVSRNLIKIFISTNIVHLKNGLYLCFLYMFHQNMYAYDYIKK